VVDKLLLSSLLVLSGVNMFAESENTPSDIVSSSCQTLSKLEKISQQVYVRITGLTDAKPDEMGYTEFRGLVRRDGGRLEIIGDERSFNNAGEEYPESYNMVRRWALPNKFVNLKFFHDTRKHWFAAMYMRKDNITAKRQTWFYGGNYGMALDAKMEGNNEQNIIQLMINNPRGYTYKGTEKVKDVSCQVFEAATAYGRLSAWISPQYDHNVLKWRVVKTRDSLHWENKPMSNTQWLQAMRAEFVFDKVEKIGGLWVITSGQFTKNTDIMREQDISIRTHVFAINRSNVVIDPDFEGLGAFKIELPERTIIWGRDIGANYEFLGGALVPYIDEYVVDSIDSETARLKDEYKVNVESEGTPTTSSEGASKPRLTDTEDTTDQVEVAQTAQRVHRKVIAAAAVIIAIITVVAMAYVLIRSKR